MSTIINQLRAELADAHAAQQAARFGRLLLVTTGAQLAALGTAHLGRDALIGAGCAVGGAGREAPPDRSGPGRVRPGPGCARCG